mmetsp:Transcript_16430/g.51462  ORF Transcript_16430/g.51462 Transcript_16430/m.51462 type:complete len:255 (-) Transcript_16430:73-837(-)
MASSAEDRGSSKKSSGARESWAARTSASAAKSSGASLASSSHSARSARRRRHWRNAASEPSAAKTTKASSSSPRSSALCRNVVRTKRRARSEASRWSLVTAAGSPRDAARGIGVNCGHGRLAPPSKSSSSTTASSSHEKVASSRRPHRSSVVVVTCPLSRRHSAACPSGYRPSPGIDRAASRAASNEPASSAGLAPPRAMPSSRRDHSLIATPPGSSRTQTPCRPTREDGAITTRWSPASTSRSPRNDGPTCHK